MKRFLRTVALLLALASFAALVPVASAAQALNEKQRAIIETAFAFHYKPSMDYDSTELTAQKREAGGPIREHEEFAPEFSTSDFRTYTVCSSFCWEVYWNVFGYKITENHSKFLTATQFTNAPEALLVEGSKHDNSQDTENIEKNAQATLKLLQPGDIVICVNVTTAFGHAMLYVGDLDGDGTPEMIHSAGKKYDLDTGIDTVEEDGNILYEPITSRLINSETWPANNGQMAYTDFRNPKTRYLVLRPLQDTAGTSTILAPAKSRVKYPGMTIDRTVNTRRYGSATTGDTLTYQIVIENHGKTAYSGLPVSEIVPSGTSLIASSVTENGTVSGNQISWKLNVPAGEKVTLKYDVTVTAKRGETIVSEGGMVDQIPSNTLKTTVSGKTPDAAKLQSVTVKDFSSAGTEFANEVYRKALGVELNLPDTKTLVKALFTQQSFNGSRMYGLHETAEPAYQSFRDMVVPNWMGGKYVYTATSKERNLDCHSSDLQPGDIVVATTVSATDKSTDVYVWTGKELLMTNGGKLTTGKERNLIALQTKDVFFVLRPSLAFDDLTKLAKLPFTDVKSGDWFYSFVNELYFDKVISGMNATTFAPSGTLTYGQALKLLVAAIDTDVGNASSGHWASNYLKAAQDKGWISGSVNLDAPISRLNFCKVAAKAKGLSAQPASNPFTDTADTDVLALVNAGVINGMSATTFQPDSTLTRAQISKIISLLRKL